MATVYKVEIIITSEWINYHESTIKELIEEALHDSKSEDVQTLSDFEIKVTKIA